jgi:hypothetical protein
MAADRQKRGLKNETQSNRQKIKFPRAKNASPQRNAGTHDCRKKTDCRNDEEIAIHSKETYCKSTLLAWQSVLCPNEVERAPM